MDIRTGTSASYLKRLVEECVDISRIAARDFVMPGFGHLASEQIRFKSAPHDLVTVVDEQVEAFITERLRQIAPEALVVGEETAAIKPDILSDLNDAELAFSVDPLDGTLNYVEGIAAFGIMIGIVSRGDPVASVIFNPVSNCAAVACRGEGAWHLDASGRRTRLQYAPPPAPDHGLRGKLSWTVYLKELQQKAGFISTAFERLWDMRCASAEYMMASMGHAHVLYYRNVMPWDHCPGYVLLTEAGGYGAACDGGLYRPGQKTLGLLYAPDKETWTRVASGLALSHNFNP